MNLNNLIAIYWNLYTNLPDPCKLLSQFAGHRGNYLANFLNQLVSSKFTRPSVLFCILKTCLPLCEMGFYLNFLTWISNNLSLFVYLCKRYRFRQNPKLAQPGVLNLEYKVWLKPCFVETSGFRSKIPRSKDIGSEKLTNKPCKKLK